MRPTPSDDSLFEQATRWHLRLRESPDRPTRSDYQRWLASDQRHAQAMIEVEAVWGALHLPAADVGEEIGLPAVAPRHRRQSSMAAMAAVLAVVAVGVFWLYLGGYDRLRSDAYTTVGEIRRLQLDDGTTLWLNTDSAVSLRLGPAQRDVRLHRGEAYFDVAHDSVRPFVVSTPAGHARVLGTAFSMRLHDDKARVSVMKGRVSVSSVGASAVLSAQQSAWLGSRGIAAEAGRDALAVTAWQRGQIVFYRAPLSEVVAELGRYCHGVIYVRGGDLRRMPISGVFDISDPAASLRLIADTLPARTFGLGDWITVIY